MIWISPCLANETPTIIGVPLYVNGSQIGEVDLAINTDSKEQIVTHSLSKELKPLLSKEANHLFDLISYRETYLPIEFSEQGFIFSYDDTEQDLHVTLPLNYLKHNSTSLKQKRTVLSIPEESFLTPSPLSGSIDFSLDTRLYHFYYSQAPSFSNVNLGTNFSLNLKDTLIDGFGYFLNYTGGNVKNIAHRLNRSNVRLTRDFVNSNSRLQLGDISPPSISFQNMLPLVGVSLLNTPNMFTNTSYSTVGQHEFILNAPSRVDVYLNDTFLRTLNLPAGPQLIKDFPFANGVNNVTLKITDPMGNTNELNLESLYAPLKIAPGELAFDAAFGFPRFQQVTQEFKYLFNEPTLSAILGSGISEHMTMQAYFQAMKRDNVYCGSSVLYYNKHLQANFEIGSSLTKGLSPGIRSRLSISSPNFDKNRLLSWQCNADFTSRSFSYLGTTTLINKEKFMFSASIASKLPAKINTSLTGYFGLHRINYPNVWSIQHTLGKYFKYGSGSIVTSYKQLDNRQKVFEMVFNFSFSPRKDTRVSSNYNTRSKTSNTQASFSKRLNPQESIGASAGLATANDTKNFSGAFKYQGPRGDAFINHYLVESAIPPLSTSSKVSGTTQINGRTAFFFADNKLCIGRPSNSSFVIIRPMGIAKKYPFYINSDSNELYAQKSSLPMGSVLPVGNYSQTSFQIDSYDMPPGFKFDNQLYHVKSRNRSGFVATVQVQAFMCAHGYFVDDHDEPIAYSSGYLTQLNSNKGKKIFFYTNSFGKFSLDNLESGTYSVHFDQFKATTRIKIIETEKIINLNKIKINLTK